MAIVIELDLDGNLVAKKLKDFEGAAGDSGKKGGNKFGSSFTNSIKGKLKSLAGVAAAAAAAFATGAFIKKSVAAAASVEKLGVQFETLLGSTQAAQKQMAELSDFASRTPFQLEGIAAANRTLLAFGISQEDSIVKLKELGDVAAASGSDFKELATVFGQVKAAGRLTGERILQFQERAVPIGAAIAKTMGIAESSVRKMVRNGKVDFKTFEKAFASLSGKGGKFKDGMKKLSETVDGLFSTLSDNIFLTFAKIGKSFAPVTKVILKDAIKAAKGIRENFDFSDLTLSFLDFAILVNRFLIQPIDEIVDIAKIAFQSVRATLQEVIIIGMIDDLKSFAEKFNLFGVFDGFIEEMTIASEASKEFSKDLDDTLDDTLTNAFSEDSATYLEKLKQTMLDAKNIVDENGVELPDSKKKKVNVDEVVEPVGGISDIFSRVKKDWDVNSASMIQTTDNMSKSITKTLIGGLGKGASSAFAAMGDAMAKGEDGMKAFAQAMMGMIGDIALQMGASFMAQGAAMLFAPGTQAMAGPLIAAGAALSVVGGAIKALSGGKGGVSGSGATGGVASSGGGVSVSGETDLLGVQEIEPQEPDTNIAVNIQGDILDSEDSGLRILDLLNNAFDKQGVIVSNNARFA